MLVRQWLEDAPVHSPHLLEKQQQRYEEKRQKAKSANIHSLHMELYTMFRPWADVLDIEDAVKALAPRVGDSSSHQPWRGPRLAGAVRSDSSFVYVRFASIDARLHRQHVDVLRLVQHSYSPGDYRHDKTATGSVYQDSNGATVILWA